jgi:hypothetical protein
MMAYRKDREIGYAFLNALCRGTDFAYRIDQPEVLAWIQSFMD